MKLGREEVSYQPTNGFQRAWKENRQTFTLQRGLAETEKLKRHHIGLHMCLTEPDKKKKQNNSTGLVELWKGRGTWALWTVGG